MPQVGGCLATIAIVLAGWAFGWWIRAGRACRDFLSPRSPQVLESETLDWAVRIRGWCAWLIALWAGSRWYRESEDWVDFVDGTLSGAFETALVIPVIILLSAIALPLLAVRGERLRILRGLLEPARTLLISVVVVVLIVLMLTKGPEWLGSATAGFAPAGEGWAMLLALAAFLLLLVGVGMMTAGMLWGIPAVLRHMFRARDAHPAYPAILTLMLCVYSLGMGLYRAVDGQWESPFPLWAQLTFLIGGPVTVAATCVTELVLLRRRRGVHWRKAYWEHG